VRRFVDFWIAAFTGTEEQGIEGDADLRQDFPPARAA
jgi:hypothetical protein